MSVIILAHSTSLPAQQGGETLLRHVRTGRLLALDSNALQLTLQDERGGKTTYALEETTTYLRRRERASYRDFALGMPVVVALRRLRASTKFSVQTLCDRETYAWLSTFRRRNATGILVEMDGDHLVLAVDGGRIEYVLSGKTRWFQENKESSPSAFHLGKRVVVAPRPRIGMSVWAVAVSDTLEAIRYASTSQYRSVRGRLAEWNPKERRIALLLGGGERVHFRYDLLPEVRQRTKRLVLSSAYLGLNASVRLKREIDGVETVTRIILEKTLRRSKPR